MINFVAVVIILAVICTFVYNRLVKSNMDIPATAEVAVPDEVAETYVEDHEKENVK